MKYYIINPIMEVVDKNKGGKLICDVVREIVELLPVYHMMEDKAPPILFIENKDNCLMYFNEINITHYIQPLSEYRNDRIDDILNN